MLENELINQTSGGKNDRRILLPLDPQPKNQEAQANFDTAEIDNSKIGETLQNKLSKMNEQKKRVNIVLDDDKYQDLSAKLPSYADSGAGGGGFNAYASDSGSTAVPAGAMPGGLALL